MKKTVFLLSLAMILLVSCEGPMGEPGADLAFHVENFTIRSGDWNRVDVGRYTTLYECLKSVDVQTEAYERGIVNVYMFQWDEASRSEVQTQLPYWIPYTEGDHTWLEGYNFDFDEEHVMFYVECRNGIAPPECDFRVVVAP